jgi:hypothetical protein
VSRAPSVYRGNPFIIEAGLAFGKAPDNETKPEKPAQPLAPVHEDAIFCSCIFNFSVGQLSAFQPVIGFDDFLDIELENIAPPEFARRTLVARYQDG